MTKIQNRRISASIQGRTSERGSLRKLALAGAVAFLSLPAQTLLAVDAVPMHWDIDGATAGGSGTANANGTWDLAATNWSTSAAGSVATVAWPNSTTSPAIAVFSAGTDVTGTSNVSVAADVSVFSILFQEGTTNLTAGSGGIVRFSSGSGLTAPTGFPGEGIISNAGTASIAAPIAGGSLRKEGAGTLTLSGVNTFTGQFVLAGGVLTVTHAGALATGSNTLIGSGTTLNVNNGITLPEEIQFSSAGTATLATGSTSNSTVSGQVILGNGRLAQVSAPSGGTLTISGPIIDGAGSATGLSKIGAGTVVLTGVNTFTNAPLIASAGTLSLAGGGTALGTFEYRAGTGSSLAGIATFRLDNSDAANNLTDRLNDFGQLTLSGNGNFVLQGNGTAASSEHVSTLTTASNETNFNANNFVTIIPGAGGTTTLSADSLDRKTGSVIVFRGTGLGQADGPNVSRVLFTGTLNLAGEVGGTGTKTQILPGALGDLSATGTGTDFVTYGVNGIRPLAASEYATSISSGSTDLVNVALSAPANVTGGAAINSLKMNSGSSVAIEPLSTLKIESGQVLINAGAGGITGGSLELPSAHDAVLHVNSDVAITSNLTGGGSSLTKVGTGTLTLSGNSTHTSPTYIEQGVVVIKSNNALGDPTAATSIAQGMSLQLEGGITVPENINIGGAYITNVRGTVGIPGNVEAVNTPNGSIGNLNSNSGNNTITGTVSLYGTAVNLGFENTNLIGVSEGSTLNISGQILGTPGANGWSKSGAGTLILSGSDPNNYTSLTRVFGGTLVIAKDGALGLAGDVGAATSNGTFILANSRSTVAFRDVPLYNNSEVISVTGWGDGNLGALDNLSGDTVFNGHIRLDNTQEGLTQQRPNYIGVQAGSLTVEGQVVDTVDNAASPGTGRRLYKIGPGALIMQGDNNYTGLTDVVEGTLAYRENGVRNPDAAAPFNIMNVYSGARLLLDNSAGVNVNRIGGVNPVTLNIHGGELSLIGSDGTDVTQDVNTTSGPTSIRGSTTLTVNSPGTTGITRMNLLTGARGAGEETLFVRGTGLGMAAGQNFITIDVAPTLAGTVGGTGTETPIVPWAVGASAPTGGPTDFVTYDLANGFRPLTSSEYATALPAGDSNQNVSLSGSATAADGTAVNSLKLASPLTLTLDGTLTVKSGAILAADSLTVPPAPGSSTITGGTLALGTAEGQLTTSSNHNLTVNSVISGSGGLTASGNGTLTLGGANTYTGTTTVNGGRLVYGADANLGAAGNGVAIGDGVLAPAGTVTVLPAARAVSVNTLSGGFDIGAGQTYTVDGVISGVGAVNKLGDGTLVLTGTNTYSGGTNITDGVLSVANDAALGAKLVSAGIGATTTIDGGTLQFTASTAMGARPVFFGRNNGTIDVQGAGTTVTFDAANGTTPFYGPGSFTKTGAGTFEFLSNSPTYNGGTFIKEGTIKLNRVDTFPGSSLNPFVSLDGGRLLLNTAGATTNIDVIMNNGGTLAGQGTSTYGNRTGFPRVSDGASVNLEAPAAADTLVIASAMTNSGSAASKPTVNVIGAGVVALNTNPAATFLANWNMNGGTLRLNNDNNALGNQGNVLSFAPAGGSVQMRTSAARTYNNPVTVNGNATFTHQSTTAAGGAGFNHTFGPLTVTSDATIAMTAPSGSNGISSGSPGLTFGATTLAGSPTFNVGNPGAGTGTGSVTLGNITETGGARNITKTGPGTLVLAGTAATNAITGDINLNAGTVSVPGNMTARSVVGAGALNIGGKMTLAPSASGVTSDVGALNIAGATDAWTGTLDVTNNDVIVRTAGGAARDTAYANALNQAKSGLAEASGNFWSGTGITSSTAAADSGGTRTAVGIILNDFAKAGLPPGPIVNEFGGRPVTENDILMKYTWFGDADLSGVVDGTDYFLIDQAFAAGTLNGGWLNGDFSYDGKVDGTDYFLIDQAFSAQTGPLSGLSAQASAVPEPSVLGLVAAASLGLLARRRRR